MRDLPQIIDYDKEQLAYALANAIKERDEAWACCDELVVDSNAITLAKTVMRLERERDEARTWGENAKRERDNWEQTAAHYLEGMHYYRRLVQEIGETIGEAAYLQDDGGKVDSVLCAKVPELVVELKRERDEAIADRDILRIDAQREAEHHDRMVGELERVYKERDEARNKMADALQEVDLRTLDFERMKQERDGLLLELEEYRSIAENIGAVKAVSEKEKAIRERDEARELCRELVDLVAYGLGQSGEPWSADAMRQAMEKIQKAKSLEAK